MFVLSVEKEHVYAPHEMAEIITRFGSFFVENSAKDYGTGEKMHTVEIHILSYIADNPGILSVQVAKDWNRTKGAVSQIIKKLEAKELIYKMKEAGEKNQLHLYVTEKGKQLDQFHKQYDTERYQIFAQKISEEFSEEEIVAGFHFMEHLTSLAYN